ncbi:MAG: hypothetical protein ACTSVI_07640 [Promethearchaeota archaeon]
MEEIYSKDVRKLKDLLIQKQEIRQSRLKAMLKLNSQAIKEIISILEKEGFLEKKKEIYRGHRVNKLILSTYKEHEKNKIIAGSLQQKKNAEIQTKDRVWSFMDESPCFFCSNFENCDKDSIINYINCPKLNNWIKSSNFMQVKGQGTAK